MPEQANRSIVGRTITGVRHLTSAEVEQIWGMPIGYGSMPLVLFSMFKTEAVQQRCDKFGYRAKMQ